MRTRHFWLLMLLCIAPIAQSAETLFAASPFGPHVEATAGHRGRFSDTSRGNRVAILNSGYEALLLRVHLIRNARRSIDIQTFIWTNDECGRLMICELIEAARRGVRVRILADHFVSDKDPETVAWLSTVHPNLEVKHYRPAAQRIKPSKFRAAMEGLFRMRDTNQRMHNKLMVFDDAIVLTGGRNIENTYFDHSTEMNFKDRDVIAVGPVAADATKSFEEFWNYRHSVAGRDLVDVAAAIRRGVKMRRDKREDYDFGGYFVELERQADDAAEIEKRFASKLKPAGRVEFLADEPGKNRSFSFRGQGKITRRLTDIIYESRETFVIQSPYLVLSSKAAKLVRMMRERSPGLRIVISSNSLGSTDNLLAYSANYRLRASYVEDLGLEIHEYKPLPADLLSVFPQYPLMRGLAERRIKEGKQSRLPFLCIHAKSFVVDDKVACIGSYNLDPRSENLNTEVGLLIEDEAIAAELKAEILRDASGPNSWVIAKRAIPLQLDKINRLVDSVLSLSPLDIWPLQNTTSFELIPGKAEVPPGHPDFYENYKEAGDFPGAERGLSSKAIVTRIYKAVGTVVTPML